MKTIFLHGHLANSVVKCAEFLETDHLRSFHNTNLKY